MSTITDQVIDFISNLEHREFTVKDILLFNPDFNTNTIRTIVSRDLVKKGIVTKKDGLSGKKDRIYLYNQPKPKKIILRKGKHKPKQIPEELEQTKPEPTSYVKIGKGIEQLLEEKNYIIANLEAKSKNLKKELLDAVATIQDRDRHIVSQGKKIHELSEKVRNKQGGAIKLDELQRVVNGA